MRIRLFALAGLAALCACSTTSPSPSTAMPGADRDGHGCICSAGYRWCARTHQCERPWELAQRQGIENTPAAVDAFCNGTSGD